VFFTIVFGTFFTKGGCKSLTQVRGGITFSNIIRLSSTK
jgi:hypothetical protein